MRAVAILATAAAACGGSSRWLDSACVTSVSPARDALVYATDDALVLRRSDGEHRVALGRGGCLGKEPIDAVIALADGWRAIALAWDTSGGNWTESGSVTVTTSCLVDFRDRSARRFDASLLVHDPRHLRAIVGSNTGWVYSIDLQGVRAIDPDRGKMAELGDTGQQIGESEAGLTTVAVRYEQTDPQHPIYRYWLVVRQWDRSAWPPAVTSTNEIAVGGRVDRLIVSADGRWAAYSGSPWQPNSDFQSSSDLGLVDLEAGKVAFEKLAVPGTLIGSDLVIAGGVPWLLSASAAAHADMFSPHRAQWLDRAGNPASASIQVRGHQLQWSPSRGKLLVDTGCSIELADLPPPGMNSGP